ncbi:hypothetical protein ACFQZ2_12360 [Streptomonospora algeriensis]|uniref:Uncharacterized protein n=1 Tax=Streptomonospora algeriensis TaxID=995084 RepID=A0ABW3BH84_9ACTN
MQPRTPYRDDDPETIQAVYASYGRMMRGAGPPEGSTTFHAENAEDLLAQMNERFGPPPEESPGAASDHLRAPGGEGGGGPAVG